MNKEKIADFTTAPGCAHIRRTTAFTLVELLVVIGIIALLISILLPALSKARQAANTAVCAANLHSIDLGMLMYANQYKGAIPGNASTSAAILMPPYAPNTMVQTKIPEVNQIWDWEAPIAKAMGVKFDEGESTDSQTSRFRTLTQYRPFLCPSNDIIYSPYTGDGSSSQAPSIVTNMISYCTSMYFQYKYQKDADAALNSVYQGYIDCGDYYPNLRKVGDTSRKIFIADAARWVTASGTAPDYNLAWAGGRTPGGVYSDPGPWSTPFTRS